MEREGVGGPASPAAAARHTRLACETGFQGACTSPTGRPAVASTPSPEVDAMVEAFRGASVAAPTGRADSLPRDLPAISVERFRLRNGLEVVMSPGGSERLARVQVTYPTGANGAPEGRHEAAHFAEHVSYHPTSRNPAGLLAATEALGATEYNGHTFAEGMTFHLEVPASALEGALALEADRMGASLDRVSEAAFENERRIITREWVTRHRDDPPAVALRAFGQRDARFLSPGSAPDEFAALTLADVRRYARDWHVPSNAQVTVVGGFDPTAARASIERYFGPIPAGDPPPRPRRAQVGPLDGESVVRVVAPAPSAETSLIVVWPLPPRYDEGGVELRLLPRLLATAAPVTLPRSVVRSIHFDIATNGDLTYLYFVARIAPGRSPEEALLRLDVALDEFRDMLPFEGLYTGPVGDLIRDVEEEAWSLSQRATRIALRPDPQDPGGFREEVRRLRAVAPPTFRALCERWFSPHRRLIVHDAPRGAR
ncbi:MAG: insulinase family protein [Polyangiales bacterium]